MPKLTGVSFQFRNFMPALADHWRLIAPDYPGFGYSDTRTGFAYTFDGYADLMDRFAMALRLKRYALYLHDYGSQIGLRPAIKAPERVAALIIQNGDIYEDQLGPKYETLRAYWANPTSEGRQKLVDALSPRRLMVWTPPLPNGIVMCQSGDETTTSTKRRSPE